MALELFDTAQVGDTEAVDLSREVVVQRRHLLPEDFLLQLTAQIEQTAVVLEEVPVFLIVDLLLDILLHPPVDRCLISACPLPVYAQR